MLKYLMILIGVTVFDFLFEIYLDAPRMEDIDLLMSAFIIWYIEDRDKFKKRKL